MGPDHKTETLRPLTKQEIDRRIGDLILEVTSQGAESIRQGEVEAFDPQWISSAEFVERMSRFLVYN